ncbi:tetratricopeptide repeat protein [Pseudonocardia eucalypti]|uniref:Tetratricopeptide repeat protein n=1 Tax=Pseudonocardia eucalypti TaxID=648755 RepID=A0ABP9PXT6_9PSEU|nr:tetratricopeptide (TPR) repeat protein [Pseudonocardia eucalypti]
MTSAPHPQPDPFENGSGNGDETFRSFRQAESLLAQGRPLDAVQALLPVLAERPQDASVHLLAGRAFLDSAQLSRAEAAFTRVLEIDPADHYARFALGKALQRQGRFTESLAQLRMASAMDPRPEYQDALGAVRARIAINEQE